MAVVGMLQRDFPGILAWNRRYTYGYGRAEDLAGIVIVVMIALSSVLVAWEAIGRLVHPQRASDLAAVAGSVGWVRGERGDRQVPDAGGPADWLDGAGGRRAACPRADGSTSLAVLVGAGGVAIGWDWADPAAGLLIMAAILAVLRQASREIYRRLMDAVDPAVVDRAEQVLAATPRVLGVGHVRMRWAGHQLRAECELVVDPHAR